MMQTAITLGTTVVACKDHVSADLAEEVVILSLKDGEYYGLNAVGAKIWSLIQAPQKVHKVRDQLIAEYTDVDPERCTRETLALLEQLAGAGLVEIVEADA
jgi:hypothetical protein